MAFQASTCLNVKRLVSCSSRGEPVSSVTHEAQQDRHNCEAPADANGGDDEQKVQQKKSSLAGHVVVVVEKESHHRNDHKKNCHAECRICQEEEEVAQLDNPCACTGSLMYAHRKCVQRWCDEKGNTICEICQQPYKSGYTASPQLSDEMEYAVLDIEAGARGRAEEESRLVLMAAAHERRFLDAQYEEANSSSAACCRSAALILMALLLLRHAIAVATTSTMQEDNPMVFLLFLVRATGFLLPCYLLVRAMNMLQRRHRHEEATIRNMHTTTTEVAIILQAGAMQARGNLS